MMLTPLKKLLADMRVKITFLSAWQNEAVIVLDGLESAWKRAGRPGKLGESKSAAMADEIARLTAENAALRADAERWRLFLNTRPPNTHEVICADIDAARSA
jgi:hypothetical protein